MFENYFDTISNNNTDLAFILAVDINEHTLIHECPIKYRQERNHHFFNCDEQMFPIYK
jgi:hypothetical protein